MGRIIGFRQRRVALRAAGQSGGLQQRTDARTARQPLLIPGGIALEFDQDSQGIPAWMGTAQVKNVGL